jgi:hypothetical protein
MSRQRTKQLRLACPEGVIVGPTTLLTLLLLSILPFIHGCRAGSVSKPSGPETSRESLKTEPSGGPATETKSELSKSEKKAEPLPIPPKELLPESVAGAPERDSTSPRVDYGTVVLVRMGGAPNDPAWQYRRNREGKIVGFEFSNRGGNAILPHRYDIKKDLLFTRDFQFRFDERARQDIHLQISDWVPSRDRQFRLSGIINSIVLFFPRNYLPAISNAGGRTRVTLPTGEAVEFDAKTYEVLAGVFSEAPVDLNPDRATRRFPAIRYTGKGVAVRADARGADPRVGKTATITTGSPPAECAQGSACDTCEVPAKELWNQQGGLRFRFSSDEAFDQYLRSRCSFGLPKDEAYFVAASQ